MTCKNIEKMHIPAMCMLGSGLIALNSGAFIIKMCECYARVSN